MLRELIKNQFIRFLCIGGINTLFGYGIFALLLFVGLHYSIAALISTILGVLFNFKTTGIIVFGSYNNGRIFHFFGVYVIAYMLHVLGLYMFGLANVSAYIAGAILILPIACVSFFLNRTFVFTSMCHDKNI